MEIKEGVGLEEWEKEIQERNIIVKYRKGV